MKCTITLDLTKKEMEVLTDLSQEKGLDKPGLLRQALRVYQAIESSNIRDRLLADLSDDLLPRKRNIDGAFDKLNSERQEIVKIMLMDFLIRDGVKHEDGSMGTIEMTPRQLRDALACALQLGRAHVRPGRSTKLEKET